MTRAESHVSQSGKLSYRSDVLRPIPHRAAIQQSVNGGRGGVGVPHCGCWSKWGKAGGDAHYCSSRQWDRTFGSKRHSTPSGTHGGTEPSGVRQKPTRWDWGILKTALFFHFKINNAGERRLEATEPAADRRRASTPEPRTLHHLEALQAEAPQEALHQRIFS